MRNLNNFKHTTSFDYYLRTGRRIIINNTKTRADENLHKKIDLSFLKHLRPDDKKLATHYFLGGGKEYNLVQNGMLNKLIGASSFKRLKAKFEANIKKEIVKYSRDICKQKPRNKIVRFNRTFFEHLPIDFTSNLGAVLDN